MTLFLWIISILVYLFIGVFAIRWSYNHPIWNESNEDEDSPGALFFAWLTWPVIVLITLLVIYHFWREEHPRSGLLSRLILKMFVK